MTIFGRESANGDFPCAKFENAKKNSPNFFVGDYEKIPYRILMNMFIPTYMPNLVTLAWKMSSGMSKEAGSLNSPLCAYIKWGRTSMIEFVRYHRVINVLAKFENEILVIVEKFHTKCIQKFLFMKRLYILSFMIYWLVDLNIKYFPIVRDAKFIFDYI